MTEEETFYKLSALCASSEHCLHEMSEKMRRWGTPYDEQQRILERLVGEKFIDEERYSRAFVADKLNYNKWGRMKIRQALAMKRIPDETAEAALNEIDDEEYIAILKPLIKAKRKSVKAASDYELNGKLIRFAMGRGFTMDVIRECLPEGDID